MQRIIYDAPSGSHTEHPQTAITSLRMSAENLDRPCHLTLLRRIEACNVNPAALQARTIFWEQDQKRHRRSSTM